MGERRHGKTWDYISFLWKTRRKSSIGDRIFLHHKIVSPVKRVEFVSDSMPYIVMRCRWSNVIALKVPATSEEKFDGSKDSFYEELEHLLDHSPNTIWKFY